MGLVIVAHETDECANWYSLAIRTCDIGLSSALLSPTSMDKDYLLGGYNRAGICVKMWAMRCRGGKQNEGRQSS